MSDLGDSFAEELRQTHAAVRVQKHWLGNERAVTKEQRDNMASLYGADPKSVKAKKALLNTGHEALKRPNAIKSDIDEFVRDNTLPFPEKGIRLLKRERPAHKRDLAVVEEALSDVRRAIRSGRHLAAAS